MEEALFIVSLTIGLLGAGIAYDLVSALTNSPMAAVLAAAMTFISLFKICLDISERWTK